MIGTGIGKNELDCKGFKQALPDLVLTANARPTLAQAAHMRSCPPCAEEFLSFQTMFRELDGWHAPEPSAFFDQKLSVMIREEQTTPKLTWLESLRDRMLFNTGRHFRPAMIGALSLALVVGGGSVAGLNYMNAPVPTASATVNDLQILDKNEQAFQQLDELQQDDSNAPQDDTIERNDGSAPTNSPTS